MISKPEILELLSNEGLRNPRAMAAVIGTANDIMKRVDLNFKRLGVYPYRHVRNAKKRGYTGDTVRSIYWTVFNRANGDEVLLRFYMSNIAKFIETASQNGTHTYSSASQISSINSQGYAGIPRSNDSGETQHRLAKPFIAGEMRVHGRMLFDRLVSHFGYLGQAVVISPFFDRGLSADEANKSIEKQMNFEIKHGGWKYFIRNMKKA